MIFLRHQKKFVFIILILCFIAGIYLLDMQSNQRRLQDIKGYINNNFVIGNDLWSSKPALFKNSQNNNTSVKPKKPSEPDFFGEEYFFDDEMPQTNCPSSIKKSVLKTDFAATFMSSVPVLQWAKHFTMSEYKRISHYHGAYGWGGVDFDVLNASLTMLNTSANRLMFEDWEKKEKTSECIRCAVVGNAGILNGSKKGKEIDQHHYVFRTNGAVINGFQEDVGSRTSFYTFSTNTFRNSLANYRRAGYKNAPQSPETRYIFLPDHDRDYILMRAASLHIPILKGKDRSSKPPSYFGSDVTVEKFKMYHPDFVRYIRNRFLRSNRLKSSSRNIYRPSTGAVMLLAALHTCDEVNAYGFMTPDFQKYSDHYFDKTYYKVHFYANHDLKMELNLWQKLHKQGLINLYMRT